MDVMDVIVIGGGNAALCAALAAAEQGARVLLLERAPLEARGGNSAVTAGALRFPYGGVEDLSRIVKDPALTQAGKVDVGRYTEDDFLGDLQRVTHGQTDPALGQALASQAFPTMGWLSRQGVEFVLAYDRQSFLVGETYRFWGGLVVKVRGEGPGLIAALYRAAQAADVAVMYESRATTLAWDAAAREWRVGVSTGTRALEYRARSVVLACGGFEANPEMRAAHLGPKWREVKVRGTPHNTGDGIKIGLGVGARPFGQWSGAHAVAWDINAPAANDRRAVQHFERDSYPLGMYVNIHGERFVDEGEDFRNYTYARFGQEIMRQPQRVAFQIFDQKTVRLLKKPYTLTGTTRIQANTLEELARAAGIEGRTFGRTVAEFNAAVSDRPFNPAIRDGKAAAALRFPKSNWAQRLDSPPYVCFPVTCGITFTFGGLRVGADASVAGADDRRIGGLFACGELVGGLFYDNYPGGTGLMAGAVFGRLAGTGAAAHAGRSG
jgi:tricarballylate dehydrogenase